jgi:hypothetical protein
MAYKDKALQREATRDRVRRYRALQKGVTIATEGVTIATEGVTTESKGVTTETIIIEPVSPLSVSDLIGAPPVQPACNLQTYCYQCRLVLYDEGYRTCSYYRKPVQPKSPACQHYEVNHAKA